MKSAWIGMLPVGCASPSAPSSAARSKRRGSGGRLRSRFRLPASSASPSFAAGARLRREAKAGGDARAASMRARRVGVRRGPSVMWPPSTAVVASVSCAVRALAAPARRASANASFMPRG
eukprot:4185730-Pleurochrysis_carterae.AAC.1